MPQFICSGTVGSCSLCHHDQANITTHAINSIYKCRNHRIRYLILGWYRYFKIKKIVIPYFVCHIHFSAFTKHMSTTRRKLQLIVLYKIVLRLIDHIPPTDYLTQTHSRSRSAHKLVSAVLYIYRLFQVSFFPRTIPLWNRLPPAAAEAPSFVSFKGSCLTLPSNVDLSPGQECTPK